jgi:thiol:disulfide interchange protein DsbD
MAESRPNAAIHLSWYLFALAVACWAMGVYQYRLTRWVVFPLVAVVGYFGLLQGPLAEANQPSASNLTGRIEAARKTGQPVFVDFTAAWCANCKTFEKLVLHTEEVQAAFAQKKVITVIADWTNPDPEIEEWLKRFGRAGVPLYLLYRPGETQPVVMDTLSTGNLLAELEKGGTK